MKLQVFLSILAVTLAGDLLPKTFRPIEPSYNNQATASDYKFSFQVETYMPSGSVLSITFPRNDYESGLGMSGTCAAQNDNGDAYSCSVSGFTVTIDVGELPNTPLDNTNVVIVKNVLNPSHTGATGLFKLATYIGINTLDYNDRFGQIGIFGSVVSFQTATITCTTNCIAGRTDATFTANIQVTGAVPQASIITIKFPDNLTLTSSVPCTSAQLPNLDCTKEGNLVRILPGQDIVASSALTIVFTQVATQSYAYTIGLFDFLVMQYGVNNIIARNLGVTSSNITPGTLTTYACPGTNAACGSQNLVLPGVTTVEFVQSVTTTLTIPANSVISIVATGNIAFTRCYVISGLTHYQADYANSIRCTVSAAKTIDITKFGAFNAGEFKVQIIADTSSGAGTQTVSLAVTTYNDSAKTNSIDTGSTSFTYTAPANNSNLADLTTNAALTGTSLALDFSPTGSNVNGTIYIRLPQSYSGTGATLAVSTPCDDGSPANTINYSSSTNILTITSFDPAATTETCTFTIIGLTTTQIFGTQSHVFTVQVDGSVDDFLQSFSLNYQSATLIPFTIDYENVNVDRPNIFKITVTPGGNLPSSSNASSLSDLTYSYSYLVIGFQTLNSINEPLFELDLGTGLTVGQSIGCTDNYTCTMNNIPATASTANYATVKVEGYASGNAAFSFKMLNVKTVQTGNVSLQPQFTIQLFEEKQGNNIGSIYSGNITPTITHYDDQDPSLPVYNGHSPTTYGGDGENVLRLSDEQVNKATTLTLVYWPELDITASDKILFQFPAQFTLSSGMTCTLNYQTSQTLEIFLQKNWVLMTVGSNLTNHQEYTFTFTGITNPPHVITIGELVMIPYVQTANINGSTLPIESEICVYAAFENLKYGPITAAMTPESLLANAVDLTYTWQLGLTNNLSTGTYIVLTYPENDFVLTTTPALECVISGLTNASCAFASNTVTISGYSAYLVSSGDIVIQINHILNPPELVNTTNFFVETFSSTNYVIDANYDINGLDITKRSLVGKILHNQFSATPTNGNYLADLTISFSPEYLVSKESVINIYLPSGEYFGLSGNLTCKSSGGLERINSCVGSGSTITILTGSDYEDTSQPIDIIIYQIANFAPGITSGPVSIDIRYSDVVFLETTELDEGRRFTTTFPPSTLLVRETSISVQTGSELAQYAFKILPSTSLTPDCMLKIKFPSTIPRGLSYLLSCSSQVLGDVTCWAEDRTLVVIGSNTYDPTEHTANDDSLDLTVEYIYNPNIPDTFGDYIVYTQCEDAMVDYGTYTESLSLTQFPGYWYYTAASTTSTWNLYNADMSFTSAVSSVESNSGDQILLYFPSDYDLTYTDSITCDSSVLSDTTSDACTFSNNVVRIDAFSNSVNTVTLTSFTVKVNNIVNPIDDGNAKYVDMAFYESSTKQVLYKTFPNLNAVNSFTYEPLGVQIIINFDEDLKVNIGNQSKTYYAILDTEAPKDVEFTTDLPVGVTIMPNPIKFERGHKAVPFIISATQTPKARTLKLNWTILGTWTTPVYAPIKRSNLNIIQEEKALINIDFHSVIPREGHSLPVTVTLERPPTTGLNVKVQKVGTEPSLLVIDPLVLSFGPGETMKTFRLSVEVNSIGYSGQLFIYKDGEDSPSYQIAEEDQNQSFLIGKRDTVSPIVQSITVHYANKSSVTFRAVVSEPLDLYYYVGLDGTRTPTVDEFVSGEFNNAEELSMKPIWGDAFIYDKVGDSQYIIEWTVSGLTAQTLYVLYYYPLDPGNNTSGINSFDFYTKDRYETVVFTVKLLTSSANDALKQSLIVEMAEILSIAENRIEVRTDYNYQTLGNFDETQDLVHEDSPLSTTSSSRGLQGVSYVDFLLYDDPNSDQDDYTPVQLVARLEQFKNDLTVSQIDLNYPLIGYKLITEIPKYTSEPKLQEISSSSVQIGDINLSQIGWIYACVQNVEYDQEPAPSATQVLGGLNRYNIPCSATFNELLQADSVVTVTLNDLSPSTNYRAFIAATDTKERYKDVNEEVKIVSFRTLDAEDEVDDDYAYSLLLPLIAALIMVQVFQFNFTYPCLTYERYVGHILYGNSPAFPQYPFEHSCISIEFCIYSAHIVRCLFVLLLKQSALIDQLINILRRSFSLKKQTQLASTAQPFWRSIFRTRQLQSLLQQLG